MLSRNPSHGVVRIPLLMAVYNSVGMGERTLRRDCEKKYQYLKR
jgi:hypothetical protein